MDDLKEKSIHHTTIKICEDLTKSACYLSLLGDIQVSYNSHLICTKCYSLGFAPLTFPKP